MNRAQIKYHAVKVLVFILDKGKCHICGKPVRYTVAVLDHIIPKAYGGRGKNVDYSDEYWNLRLAHKKCNIRRGAAKIAGQLRFREEELCLNTGTPYWDKPKDNENK